MDQEIDYNTDLAMRLSTRHLTKAWMVLIRLRIGKPNGYINDLVVERGWY
jgi:hypothetical protein